MSLETLWFCLIAGFWAAYLMLEGFDFGVGMLLPVIGRDTTERSELLGTVGPVWDANEVWLVIVGGATFAAFPDWYATMFSGFYQALLLVLLLLMVRVVSFEWTGRREGDRWQARWLWANTLCSLLIPLVWGIALANLVGGVPLNSSGEFVGSFSDLFSPFTVAAGLTFVCLSALNGAVFLQLKLVGDLRARAVDASRRLAIPVVALTVIVVSWTVFVSTDANHKSAFPAALVGALAALAVALGGYFGARGVSRRAFAAVAIGIILVTATIFVSLYPRVLVSNPDFGNSLTIQGASSSHYALQVITVVAVIVAPIVLIYQGWTYHVLRRRLAPGSEPPKTPAAPAEQ